MLLTKTQKKILENVREYGGMRADMLNSLCPDAYSFEVMLAVCGHPPEIYCRGQPPFSLTFFKEREQKLCRYDICVVTDGREQVVNAMLGGMAGKYGTAIFVLEQKEQAERMIVPPDCRFAVKENAKYIFYGGC